MLFDCLRRFGAGAGRASVWLYRSKRAVSDSSAACTTSSLTCLNFLLLAVRGADLLRVTYAKFRKLEKLAQDVVRYHVV